MKRIKLGQKRWDIPCNFGTDEQEFEQYVGHKPTRKEMEEFVCLLKKGMDAQLDWDMITREAAEHFKKVEA